MDKGGFIILAGPRRAKSRAVGNLEAIARTACKAGFSVSVAGEGSSVFHGEANG